MKNIKVSSKLFIGFLIVIIMALIVGIVGIYGMTSISSDKADMYYQKTKPTPYLGRSMETLQRIRVNVREMVIASINWDMNGVDASFRSIEALIPVMEQNMNNYREGIVNPEAIRLFDDARQLYERDLTQTVLAIHAASLESDYPTIQRLMRTCVELSDRILGDFDRAMSIAITDAQTSYQASEALSNMLLTVIIAVLAVAIVIAVLLVIYISGLISKPLAFLAGFMQRVSSTGDLKKTADDEKLIRKYMEAKDEIGQTVRYCEAFFSHVDSIAHELETIAGGDLSNDVEIISDRDTMGKSLKDMLENLNRMFAEINSASGQVTAGAKQIADGAQSLAQGSTQQAASVQQLSSSMAEIAQKTKTNSSKASQAASLAETIKGNAEKGSHRMDGMMSAVKDINSASQSISKVIKVIDDIAFQTNILALNAAVEAARAGQHGKGFAVVAEEVRNLAAKSAEAAKDTGGLIANSIEKAELGARIAEETASSLVEIVSGINDSNQIVNEIAQSSEEQYLSIEQINTGIDQVAQVVQQNSATAEQSAAASEEMSGQSAMLEELISQFKLKGGSPFGAKRLQASPPPAETYSPPEDIFDSGGSDSFGKY